MSALISAFIAGRYQRLLLAALWGALLAALLGIGYGFIVWQVTSSIGRDQRAELARITEIRGNAVYALQKLKQEATAPPCSPDFLAEMQRVAYLPDGLNEFLYAPNGRVECSTSRPKFETPVPLGAPDVDSSSANAPSLRIDRDLASIGRSGTMGTIAQLGAFAVAIPPYTRYQNDATWLKKELVALGPHGKVWSIAGDHGLYHRLSSSSDGAARLATVSSTRCDDERLYCVASRASLLAWARDWAPILSSVAVLAALFAWVCATNIVGWLNRHWSFEARFSRHLDAKSIVVVYQPVLDLRSGKISGCEVLARWRDIDGTIVAPSRFIDIVERTGRTEEFTRLVADRAYEELSACLPSATRLQVAFNVFACDLDSAKLLAIYSRFLDGDRRLEPAIELVENQDIDFEAAERAIDELDWAGIKSYIDDFGIGYSSIERAATLAVHGVKLDRSFAMSPPDSIMGQMLVQVLEMIKTTGHLIVVEGVATEARLDLLRATGIVDCVQGYEISRPLGIDEFVAFLGRDKIALRAREVAA